MIQCSKIKSPGDFLGLWASHHIWSIEVIWTTPTEVLGVLPVIVIFGLWECSQYCYTTFVGVLPMSTPSVCFLTVWECSLKYYTTFVGVLPQKWYSTSGSTPKLAKMLHRD